MDHRTKNIRFILLAAIVITFFMMLPRIGIVAYLKLNPDHGLNEAVWLNTGTKFLYTFLIALVFLWININRFSVKPVNTYLRWQRLLVSIVLFLGLRYLFKLLGLPAEREAVSVKATVFLFNIGLVIEVVLCILVAEIYLLLISNQQQKLNNERLLKANAEATFEALKTQVNPHFLFNSLNTINAILDNDAKAAKKFVTNMSHVYRYLLNSTRKPVITLAEEMEFTMAYVSMLLQRHSGSLNVNVNIPDTRYGYFLPSVSVQILVENAVKHNIVSVRSPLTIDITVEADRLIVSNTLNEKKNTSGSTGTGLYNLNKRYLHLCNQEIEITKTDAAFIVAIPLLQSFAEMSHV